ncbi:MAG: DUF2905 domain-containing protein [Vicinamibacterales bacterium]|nr:DUF2905 domain-containing protein [Vicinamibacterales bacterium]
MTTFLAIAAVAAGCAGLLIWVGVPLGRLPGDLVIRRERFTLYLPITTSLLAGAAIWLVFRLLAS